MQRELPARLAFFLRRCTRRCDGIIRQTSEICCIGNPFSIRIGSIQHILGKLCSEGREFFLDSLETRLFVFRQFCARQPKIAQFIVDDFFARSGERTKFTTTRQRLVF